MRGRLGVLLLAGGVGLGLSGLSADASAAPPAPACSITGVSPHEVVIGYRGVKNVRFSPVTDCPDAADLNWYLTVRKGPQPWGFVVLANFWQPPWSRYRYDPEGVAQISAVNAYAGRNELLVQGFFGEETGEPADYLNFGTTVVLKRATGFGGTFDAAPENPARGATLTFTGRLTRVNWDAGEYEAQDDALPATTVALQFRPKGATAYRNVKLVRTAQDGTVTTTERATQTGTWRLKYLGDAVSGASQSREDYVAVP